MIDCSKFFIFNQKVFVFKRTRFFFSKLRDSNQNTLREREFSVSTRYDRNDCDFFQKSEFRNDERKRRDFDVRDEFRNELLFFRFLCLYLFLSHVYYFA